MKKITLIVFLFCIAYLSGFAQVCQTEGKLIREVSVNANGEPVITWNKPTNLPANATGYIVYDYLGTLPDCTLGIDTLTNFNDTVFIDTRNLPLTETRTYCLVINKSTEPEPLTQQHAFSFLKAEYDSCRYSITLNWTPYVGWDESATYKIYGGIAGDAFTLLADNISDTTYTIIDVPDNEFYEVYIEAVNMQETSIVSASNRVTLRTTTPQRPEYLNIHTLKYIDSKVSLQFDIDANTELSTFLVTRGEQPDGIFETIHSFSNKTATLYEDNNVETIYYYQLQALNSCDLQVPVKENNVINNLQLSQETRNGQWHLSWSELYDNNPRYNLNRLQPNPAALLSLSTNTVFDDNIDFTEPSLEYCYRVEAVGEKGVKSITEQCNIYEAEILMPNAVNPTSIVLNVVTGRARNQFGPLVYAHSSMYQYQLEIYGKNGDKIASIQKMETDSPLDKSWLGTLSNGNYAPEGMYIYRLKLTFTDGRVVTKTGSVAVVYE